MIMNVAIIVSRLCDGGAERTAAHLSRLLNENHTVYLIVFNANEITYPYAGKLLNINIPATSNWAKRLWNLLKRARKVKKLKKKYSIDVSISFMEGANFINVLTRRNERIITSVRNHMSQFIPANPIMRKLSMIIQSYDGKYSDTIVALSEGVKRDLTEFYGLDENKIVTIYNPCDPELLKKESVNAGIVVRKHSIITMGRLTRQKGQWHLIRAFKEIKRMFPDAQLNILGDGELKEKLITLTGELGLQESVHFIGYVKGPHSIIRQNEVFVFPSLYEGLGYALLEALSCDIPCIATDCLSGPREILAPGTTFKGKMEKYELSEYGILVSRLQDSPFDSNSPLTKGEMQIVKAIQYLFENDVARKMYIEKAKTRILDFSPQKIGKQWENILK